MPPLNELMEFDRVIQVTPKGVLIYRPDIPAPEVMDGELIGQGWTLMNGYSGQHGYSGPIMHSSEFIGGGMERDILSTPGFYVALVANYSTCDECEGIEDADCQNDHAEGWAVARQEEA